MTNTKNSNTKPAMAYVSYDGKLGRRGETPMIQKTMDGRVTGRDGHYLIVECPDAAPHLRHLNLTPGQMMGAIVGDQVRLAYQTTSHSGLWNVIAIIKAASALITDRNSDDS